MSTRASVQVYDERNTIYFYQHCDGYPEGLGEWLKQCLALPKVSRHKGDIEYLCGALLMEANRDYIEKNLSCPDLVPAVSYHGDESYTYKINADTLEMETV